MTTPDFPYDTLAPHTFDLTGRTAVVTGGAGHLGGALSDGLAAAGAHVHLIGRNATKLEAAVAAIRARGQSAEHTVLDLTDITALQGFTQEHAARGDAIDILVNNAYAGPTGTLQAATAKDYADTYHIGMIVAAEPYYGAVKGALLQYTRYAAVHLAGARIRVNAISPGPFPPLRFREEKPDFYQHLISKVPMKRIGTPADMIGPLVFLASPHAQYVTGTNMCVDGGWTAW